MFENPRSWCIFFVTKNNVFNVFDPPKSIHQVDFENGSQRIAGALSIPGAPGDKARLGPPT